MGDIATNSKRGLIALIPIRYQIGYHLFDVKSLKYSRKAKWQPDHQSKPIYNEYGLTQPQISSQAWTLVQTAKD